MTGVQTCALPIFRALYERHGLAARGRDATPAERDVVRDAFEGAIEDQDVALVFPLEVGPAVWTPLRNYRFGRQFLQRALQSERQRLDALEDVDSALETSERG